ncbi:hypothetical protein FQK07_11165 [Synechococcus sp. BSF8S]|uniref:PspA/IM30 family protein n=1 Tax=Synechococcales TaxID=1890424 RepID=UPI0016246305|nr:MULTISPECIES: hypothetical protein [unclassified Synechococcus]MBC1261812.1 hypothetical protein [Synechococcus sp. BSF8S]MBC1264741.1 hypothetical protein [Synechococcus sp. BSA11S]
MPEEPGFENLIDIIRRQDRQLRELQSRIDEFLPSNRLVLCNQVEAVRQLNDLLPALPDALSDGTLDPIEALAIVDHVRREPYYAILCFSCEPAADLAFQATAADLGGSHAVPRILVLTQSLEELRSLEFLNLDLSSFPTRLLAVVSPSDVQSGGPSSDDVLPMLLETCSGHAVSLDLLVLCDHLQSSAVEPPQHLLESWQSLLDGLSIPFEHRPLAPEVASTLLCLRLRPDTDCSRAALDAIADLKRLDQDVADALPNAPQPLADLLGATHQQLHRALERLAIATRESLELRRQLEQASPDPATARELEDLRAQLEEAREESDLLLEQLHQTQEKLEHYVLLSRGQQGTAPERSAPQGSAPAPSVASQAPRQKDDAVNTNRGRLLSSA